MGLAFPRFLSTLFPEPVFVRMSLKTRDPIGQRPKHLRVRLVGYAFKPSPGVPFVVARSHLSLLSDGRLRLPHGKGRRFRFER